MLIFKLSSAKTMQLLSGHFAQKCDKFHLQPSRFQKFFRGRNPRTAAYGGREGEETGLSSGALMSCVGLMLSFHGTNYPDTSVSDAPLLSSPLSFQLPNSQGMPQESKLPLDSFHECTLYPWLTCLLCSHPNRPHYGSCSSICPSTYLV